jgi:ABC-type oligopeptide transport system ATPase subunit
VQSLCVHFGTKARLVKAVDGVSFELAKGTTMGLVGESGSGKSTVGRAILGLIPATSGSCEFEGSPVLRTPGNPLTQKQRRVLCRRMQIIFQDPAGSLNPRLRVGDAIAEPMLAHALCEPRLLRERVLELLERCGLQQSAFEKFPHELSGGQKQRAVIARALAVQPAFLVCDEPTSALDVSIQAQILNLLVQLQKDFGLSYLFISHDLAVVKHMADTIAVMQRGVIVEQGPAQGVLEAPTHAYTKTLLSAVH